MSKEIRSMDNFILVEERKGNGPLVVQTFGYTADEKSVKEPWICTQLRTLPHLDRSCIPDPLILKHNIRSYEYLDCNLWTLYFTPKCGGLEVALKEFARYYALLPEKPILLGYSKGGLFFGALTDCLEELELVLIAPTLKTITGDEKEMLRRIEEITPKCFQEKIVKFILEKGIRTIGSRRPIDKDMSIGSEFTRKHTLKNLKNNRSLLIIGKRGKLEEMSLVDRICYRFADYLGIPKDSDGITEIKGIEAAKTVYVEASHLTILEKPETNLEVHKFLMGK